MPEKITPPATLETENMSSNTLDNTSAEIRLSISVKCC